MLRTAGAPQRQHHDASAQAAYAEDGARCRSTSGTGNEGVDELNATSPALEDSRPIGVNRIEPLGVRPTSRNA